MEDAAWAELHCCPESLISWSYAGCVQATGAGTKSLAGWRAGMQLGNLDIPICSSERGYIGSGNIFMAEVCVPQETNIEALLTIWGSDMEHLRA
jgi:hypothetical protein